MRLIAVLVLAVALVGCTKAPPPYESRYTEPTATRAAYLPAERPPFNPATISGALRTTEPYVISVLGDSTGNAPGEWVHLVAEHIAKTFGRAVTVHDWDSERNAYGPVHTYGVGAPVTVWNGSGPGKAAQYSKQWFGQMAPLPVNLTMINHGHNKTQDAIIGIAQLVDLAYGNTIPGGGVVVMLQNPRTDKAGQDEPDMINRLKEIYADPQLGVALVDVNSAFKVANLVELLREDGVHPSELGSRVWADTVITTLGLK